MTRLYAYGAVLLVLAGLLLAGGWWAYEKGKDHQAAINQKAIASAKADRDAALAQVSASAQALQQVNAAAAQERANAKQQQGKAKEAIATLGKQASAAVSEASAWQAKYQAALKTPACHIAQEELCDSLTDY